MTKEPIEIFCCYAREDESLLHELRKHLKLLQYQGLITIWSDMDTSPGENWEEKSSERLNTASFILLLVSPDFLQSDYCYKMQMMRALERRDQGEAYVIPIILRSCGWEQTPLGKIKALPLDKNSDAKPVKNWDSLDDAFVNILNELKPLIAAKYQENLEKKAKQQRLSQFELLAALLQHYRKILHTLGLTKEITRLQVLGPSILANFLSQSPYRILVVGEFKRGKSTFINSLIGQEILPAFAIPTTANITEIKWAPEPHALLHFREAKDAVIKEPQEVDLSQLQNYISYQKEDREFNNYYKYEKIELYWPLELLRNDVELIDTPGLSEFQLAQNVMTTYIRSADMILFVLAADLPVSLSEINYIQALQESGYSNIFYIGNRIDVIEEDKVEVLKQHILRRFTSLEENIEKRLFLMSARGALNGRLHANREQIEQSGLLPFEEMLKRFLGKEYKPMKFPQLMTDLQGSIHTAKRISISEGLKNSYFDLNEIDSQFLALIKQDT